MTTSPFKSFIRLSLSLMIAVVSFVGCSTTQPQPNDEQAALKRAERIIDRTEGKFREPAGFEIRQ